MGNRIRKTLMVLRVNTQNISLETENFAEKLMMNGGEIIKTWSQENGKRWKSFRLVLSLYYKIWANIENGMKHKISCGGMVQPPACSYPNPLYIFTKQHKFHIPLDILPFIFLLLHQTKQTLSNEYFLQRLPRSYFLINIYLSKVETAFSIYLLLIYPRLTIHISRVVLAEL